ncbi:hypothetical protein GGR58DRAFT_505221 [Xylaria digitata]|nr:hypothetical protein GGR58DRAFT_505221 [Xylaria digitata]
MSTSSYPGIWAMPTVYSTPTSTWTPAGTVLPTCGPQTLSFTVPSNYGKPTKRRNPPSMAAFGPSPLAEAFANHTPISNSLPVYLQQRPSPYKPVRLCYTIVSPRRMATLGPIHLGAMQGLCDALSQRLLLLPPPRSTYFLI